MAAARGERVAARSRRGAALSGRGKAAFGGRAGAPHRRRRALCAAARHGRGAWRVAGKALSWERDRRSARWVRAAAWRPIRRRGAMSCWRANPCRPAITSRSSSMTRPKASPTWCAGRICSGRPACTGCCRCCWGLPAPRYHHHRLLRDAQGRKLSKSTQAPSLARRCAPPACGRRAGRLEHDRFRWNRSCSSFFGWSRFLHANRCPLRSKTL